VAADRIGKLARRFPVSSPYKLRPNPGAVAPGGAERNDAAWDPTAGAQPAPRGTRTPFPLGRTKAPFATPPPAEERSTISRKLEDLLIREAHLTLSRSQLAPALAEQEAALREVVDAKPALLAFQAKEKRQAYETRLAEAKETVQMLRDGVAQLDRVEPHIRRMLRDEIEDLLRAACPEYLQALAARQQKEDWRRCIQRFATRVYEFLQALGNARNMACTGYTRERQVFSQAAVQGFVVAIAAAEKVESEVAFANRIADLQERMFRECGLDAPPLPRLKDTTYAVWVSTISSRALGEAQLQFDTIIADVRRLYEEGIPQLLTQAEAADQGHGSLIDNFLTTAWEQLREEVAVFVAPADTEASVASTERMLVELAKGTVHGRLKESGATRPPMPMRPAGA
jgi:hypothetical protein